MCSSPPATESYQYYDNGNLKRDGRWDYTWDAEHRLTKMETLSTAPAGSKRRLEFQYDYKGRRIWKRETNLDSSAVVVRKYVYDGWNLLAESDSGNSLIRSYIWGTDLSGSMHGAGGVGGLLGLKGTDGIVHFTAYEGNGNVVGLVNSDTGEISAQYEYSPFGELLRETGVLAKANPFGFSTKFTDRESGMVYYGYRYYTPSTGRWLSRDPIEESGGNALYAACANDMLNQYDILGLKCDEVLVVIFFSRRDDDIDLGSITAKLAPIHSKLIWKSVRGPLTGGAKVGEQPKKEFPDWKHVYYVELKSINTQSLAGPLGSGALKNYVATVYPNRFRAIYFDKESRETLPSGWKGTADTAWNRMGPMMAAHEVLHSVGVKHYSGDYHWLMTKKVTVDWLVINPKIDPDSKKAAIDELDVE